MVKWLVGIIFFDQLSKFLAPRLGFEIVYNKGVAFGMFPDFAWIIILIIALLLYCPVVILFRKKSPNVFASSSLGIALILGGGISNLFDRFVFGAVRDFIDFGFWPSFNLADAAISFGFLLLVSTLTKR